MSFEQWVRRGLLPAPLADSAGLAYAGGCGAAVDDQVERQRTAIQSGMPGLAPGDALDRIGAQRQIPRSSGETDAAYGERLRIAWDLWADVGSHTALHRALAAAGYTNVAIVPQFGHSSTWNGTAAVFTDLPTLPPWGRAGFYFDELEAAYARFCLVFTSDPGNLYTDLQHEALRTLVSQWKPPKTVFLGASVLTTGSLLGMPGPGTDWISVAWGYPASEWGAVGTWGERAAAGVKWGQSRAYWIPGDRWLVPADITGVLGWWEGDSITQAAGAALVTWPRMAGTMGPLEAGAEAWRPTVSVDAAFFNGHKFVRFDKAVPHFLSGAVDPLEGIATLSQPFDVFLAYRTADAGTIFGAPSTTDRCDYREDDTVLTYGHYLDAGTTRGFDVADHYDFGKCRTIHLRFDGPRSRVWAEERTPLMNLDIGSNPVGASIILGATANGMTANWSGDLAAVIVLSGGDPTQYWGLRNYLRTRYRTSEYAT